MIIILFIDNNSNNILIENRRIDTINQLETRVKQYFYFKMISVKCYIFILTQIFMVPRNKIVKYNFFLYLTKQLVLKKKTVRKL